MRCFVTCEICQERQAVERRFYEPQRVWIICIKCECPIYFDISAEDLKRWGIGTETLKAIQESKVKATLGLT